MKRFSYFCNEVKRMTMKRSILIIMLCIIATAGNAQLPLELSRMNRQKAFKKAVPAGNYSGITRFAGNHYALVSDKADQMGFYLFTIDIDSISGKLRRVACEDFISTGMKSDDEEAIAYVPQSQTLWLTSEATTTVRECDRQGRLTGRQLPTQQVYGLLDGDQGLEALTYDSISRQFWTCQEGAPVSIRSFSADLTPQGCYAYCLDEPTAKRKPLHYAHGVSELLALADGTLLVMEREFFVPKKKIGSFVVNKIYRVAPHGDTAFDDDGTLKKQLVAKWKTRLNLTRRSLANYEGMCLGPRLTDGRQVIILVSDSQNQYGGILKDYFKTIVITAL